MRHLTSLSLLLFAFALLAACQHEEFAGKNRSLPSFEINPEFGNTLDIGHLNDHVSYRLPRFPRPLPCPVLAGCQLPDPEFLLSVAKGGSILKAQLELFTTKGEMYASSSEEFGGQVVIEQGGARVSLGVIDDQASSENLSLRVQMIYEIDGKKYGEEFYEESVPVFFSEYQEAGSVMYRFPRFPRPLPCPVLAGCQVPNPELHVIVPNGEILEMTAQLYTENEELYACAGKECASEIEIDSEEALATFTVVNPEITAENLILALQITYEVDGEVVSEEIYSKNVPLDME